MHILHPARVDFIAGCAGDVDVDASAGVFLVTVLEYL